MKEEGKSGSASVDAQEVLMHAHSAARFASAHHLAGDNARKMGDMSRDPRARRKWQNTARACRAAAIGAEASLWLFSVVSGGMIQRKVSPAVQARGLVRLMRDAAELADVLAWEANVLTAYQPIPSKKKGI